MLLSAAYQVSHPLPTRASPTGHFSSRFITVCITGNAEGAAEPIAWQATEQAEAMVKAGIVEASVDPGVVRVRRPGKDEYIPEVFYRYDPAQMGNLNSERADDQFQERVRCPSEAARQAHIPRRIPLRQCELKSTNGVVSLILDHPRLPQQPESTFLDQQLPNREPAGLERSKHRKCDDAAAQHPQARGSKYRVERYGDVDGEDQVGGRQMAVRLAPYLVPLFPGPVQPCESGSARRRPNR